MTTGLILGRFQPFHLGHLNTVKHALDENDDIIIAIGSAQESGTEKNPYSAEQREEMIRSCLSENELKRITFFKIPDINDNDRYVEHVIRTIGKIDVFYAGDNDLTRMLFLKGGYKVKRFGRFKDIRSTEIRKLIKENKDISDLVPEEILKFIKKN